MWKILKKSFIFHKKSKTARFWPISTHIFPLMLNIIDSLTIGKHLQEIQHVRY
jgi:hypothetical protein